MHNKTDRAKFVEFTYDARTEVRAVTDASGRRTISGIATTPTPDRVGDIVLSEGAQFQLPIPLLFSHDPERPMGNVTSAVVTAKGISFTAEFAAAGVTPAIDQRYAEIVAGLWRFVSIGFRSLKSKAGKTGRIFESWEWLELSLVSIPANSDAAITAVKAFQVPTRAVSTPPVYTGAPAYNEKSTGQNQMNIKKKTIAELITESKQKIAAHKDALAELAGGDDIDETKQAQIDELVRLVETETRSLETREAAEDSLQKKAVARAPGVHVEPQMRSGVKADLLFKNAAAHFLAHMEKRSLESVLESHYSGHDALQAYMKAVNPSRPADTTTPGWAAELVHTQNADFLEQLLPLSVYASLSAMGNRFSFGRNGSVTVPSRSLGAPNLAGDFVGEGMPIRVGQTVLSSIKLLPHKAAVISTFTRELAQHSTPAIESMIRTAMLEDTALLLDTRLLDNVAGNAIRPAGIRNGVVGIPSAGTTAADIVADLRAAISPIVGLNGGRKLVWLINPTRLMGLTTLQSAAGTFTFRDEVNTGRLFGYPFIASNNVPADSLILIDAADFATASDDTPEFDVSDVATLHEEQSQPDVLPIVGATAANVAFPVRSLWQTGSIGIRYIQSVTWAMRRPGMITEITGVAW